MTIEMFLSEILPKFLPTLGLSTVFLALYLLERNDRKQLTKEFRESYEHMSETLGEHTTAIRESVNQTKTLTTYVIQSLKQ